MACGVYKVCRVYKKSPSLHSLLIFLFYMYAHCFTVFSASVRKRFAVTHAALSLVQPLLINQFPLLCRQTTKQIRVEWTHGNSKLSLYFTRNETTVVLKSIKVILAVLYSKIRICNPNWTVKTRGLLSCSFRGGKRHHKITYIIVRAQMTKDIGNNFFTVSNERTLENVY